MPPHGRRARPALARLRPLHGPLGPGPAQARLHTVRPHMATLGPVTHLTSRLLTLRWLGTLRGLSPLSLAARMLLTPLTPLCAVRRSHWAGLLRRRSPHPAHAALLRIPLPTIALACYTALTSPSLRVGPARPGLTADPTLSLSPHTLRWPAPARHSAQGSPYAPLLLTSHAVSRQRAAPGCLPGSGPGQARPYTYSHTRPGSTWPARPARSRPAPGPLAPLAPGPPRPAHFTHAQSRFAGQLDFVASRGPDGPVCRPSARALAANTSLSASRSSSFTRQRKARPAHCLS